MMGFGCDHGGKVSYWPLSSEGEARDAVEHSICRDPQFSTKIAFQMSIVTRLKNPILFLQYWHLGG